MNVFAEIIVRMYYEDTGQHSRPHVHVKYGEFEASVSLDGEVLSGFLPRKQYRMVSGWLAMHEDEVYEAWNNAVRGIDFAAIEGV